MQNNSINNRESSKDISLYQQAISEDNIILAAKRILCDFHSEIPGPDKITSKKITIKNDKNTILKEVKTRLRRYKKPSKVSRTYIDEVDPMCILQEYNIYNLFDRITQQAILNVLESTNLFHISDYNNKRTISLLTNILQTTPRNFFIHTDFENLLKDVSIDYYLDCLENILKENNFNGHLLMKSIKHMYYTKDFTGKNINKNDILSKILIEAYLMKNIDIWVETNTNKTHNSYCRDFEKHKGNFISWLKKLKKNVHAQYYRISSEIILVCHSVEEQKYLINELKQYNSSLSISTSYNKFNFQGFYIKKRILERKYIEIKIDNYRRIEKFIQNFKFNSFFETWNFKRWYASFLSYFDIVNDLSEVRNYIIERMYYRSNKHSSHLKKVDNSCEYIFKGKGITLIFDIFDMSTAAKISYKEYIFGKVWIKQKDNFKPWNNRKFTNWGIYKQELFIRQQGKDVISKEYLNFSTMNIHHKNERKNGGEDRLKNLILINEDTHINLHKK